LAGDRAGFGPRGDASAAEYQFFSVCHDKRAALVITRCRGRLFATETAAFFKAAAVRRSLHAAGDDVATTPRADRNASARPMNKTTGIPEMRGFCHTQTDVWNPWTVEGNRTYIPQMECDSSFRFVVKTMMIEHC
jgi:hypothetical protein